MQLEHTFTVPAGVEQAWQVLLDIERIAPCMPGAAIDSVDGDDFTGTVKVRLGPIGLTYKGKATFVEKDAVAHRTVIDARGKDSRGNGTATAKITATLVPHGDGTAVTVLTDLNITGKPAQFGRGVMVDVGNKLIGQFADCLAGKLASGEVSASPAADAPSSEAATSKAATSEAATSEAASSVAASSVVASSVAASSVVASSVAASSEAALPVVGSSDAGVPTSGVTGDALGAPADEVTDDTDSYVVAIASFTSEESVTAGGSEPTVSVYDNDTPTEELSIADAPVEDVPVGAAAGETAPPLTATVESRPPTDAAGAPSPTAAEGPSGGQHRRTIDEVEPIDLLGSAGPAVAKRLAPVALAAIVIALVLRALRHRR